MNTVQQSCFETMPEWILHIDVTRCRGEMAQMYRLRGNLLLTQKCGRRKIDAFDEIVLFTLLFLQWDGANVPTHLPDVLTFTSYL